MLRLSLAGNLKDYEIVDARGVTVRGDKLFYGSSPAGYAVNPWETVNYAACHDNETLFDQVTFCTTISGQFEQPPPVLEVTHLLQEPFACKDSRAKY